MKKTSFEQFLDNAPVMAYENLDLQDKELADDIDKIRKYSGKISVRVPKKLHRELTEEAKDNGVSLNQFIVYKLAKQ